MLLQIIAFLFDSTVIALELMSVIFRFLKDVWGFFVEMLLALKMYSANYKKFAPKF